MTTAVLDQGTRDELRSKAEHVESLVEKSIDERPSAEEALSDRVQRRMTWYRLVQDALLDLANRLPDGTEEHEALQLFKLLTELGCEIADDADARDESRRIELTAMKIVDVLRRLARRLEHSVLEDPGEAARYVFVQLGALSANDLARLLGVSTKTVGAWRAGKPVRQKTERVKLVAQLVSYVRYSMTPTGVLMWFDNEADVLDGQSPMQIMDAGISSAWAPLVSYARGGRGQLAG